MTDARSQVYSFVNKRGDQMARYGPAAPYQKMIEPGTDDDLFLHGLLNQVEDDRAHAEAERLRKKADGMPRYTPPKGGTTGRAVTLALADEMDPYEERDGQLVRKSDGRPVVL